MNHLGVVDRVAVGDVRWREAGRGSCGRQGQRVGKRCRTVVDAAQEQMGGVIVQSRHRQAKGADDMCRLTIQYGMTLRKQGVERPAQAMVVEFLRRNAPQELGAAFLGPACDIDERQRLDKRAPKSIRSTWPCEYSSCGSGGKWP